MIFDGFLYSIQLYFFAVDIQFAADVGTITFAEQAHGQFRSSRTHQAGNSHYFTFFHIKIDIIHHLTVRIQWMMHGPVFDLHQDLSDLRLSLRESVGDLSSYHSFDDPALGNIIFSLHKCFDGRSVTNDGDLICHIRNLIQLMRDDDGCHSLFLEFQHQIQQCLGIRLIQRGSRLIQDQKFCVLGQCLRNLYQLLFSYANILYQCLGAFLQAYGLQKFCRPGIGFIPVDFVLMSPFIAQKHIFPDRHIGNQCKLLMNDYDTLFLTVLDLIKFADLTVIDDVPFVRPIRIYTAQYIHQCGLSCAVFAYKCVDLSLFHLQVYIVKCFYTGECFGYIFHFQ